MEFKREAAEEMHGEEILRANSTFSDYQMILLWNSLHAKDRLSKNELAQRISAEGIPYKHF